MKLNHCYHGDCRDVIRQLLDQGAGGKVQAIVTSPPYWNLRDYGVAGQIGMEPTLQEFVSTMVEVFALCRELLADDGTLWLNLGDSYNAAGRTGHGTRQGFKQGTNRASAEKADHCRPTAAGLKEKDLCGVPWRVAFALQQSGWVLRQEIIWSKPNPMPESVRDRCTKSHEQVFLFSKAKWCGPTGGRFSHISDEDARWLALCIDTEGCIVVKRAKQNDGGADSFSPQVTFGGTSRALVERFQQIVGHGNICERSGTNAPMLYWQLGNNLARDFLYRIYHHLIIKQRQARIGIYVDDLVYYRGGQFPDRKRRTDSENGVLMSLWERNKACNKFGDPDLSDVPEPIFGRWASQKYYFDQEAILEPCSPGTHARLAQNVAEQIGNERANGGAKTNGNMKAVSRGGVDQGCGQRQGPPGNEANPRKAYSGTGVGFGRGSDAEQRGRGRVKNNESFDAAMAIMPDKRNKRSVWTIATQSYSEAHFATFPEALVEPCILAGSRPGDIVFDPFMGSGTVAQVAQNLGRKWIGSELNPEYIALQSGRTRQAGLEFAA